MSQIVKTIGLSPKVYEPVIGQLVLGVILLLAGDKVEGKTLLVTALGTLAAGVRAKPGDVQVKTPAAPEGETVDAPEAFGEHDEPLDEKAVEEPPDHEPDLAGPKG